MHNSERTGLSGKVTPEHGSSCQLVVTPAGRVAVRELGDGVAVPSGAGFEAGRVVKAFSSSQAEGLFCLAAEKLDLGLPPSFAFWQDFARRYLTELCHTPEAVGSQIDAIQPPDLADLQGVLLSVPPMLGGEYLTADTLLAVWSDLDGWVRREVESHKEGLASFLKQHAPLWRQVGRVCFHLAENKRDPDYPFAFMATYIPRLSRGSRAHYQPLGKALEQYAGAKNKQALVRLLSPVHLASEKSRLVKELVDSGDVFHALAWTPGEAYQFLKDAPLYEESGILVRLPNWWTKRPRPRAGIVIGQNRKNAFDAKAMLDFNLVIALGDEKLTEDEWRELMDADDGLVFFKGQWVEVNRAKLTAALEHWKKVEKASLDGSLSFIEGMRLLAGAPADLDVNGDLDQAEQEWSFVGAGDWLSGLLSDLRSPENLNKAKPGKALRATLRGYQEAGVDWLWLMTNLGLGACLADDMGLGKTIQVLSILVMLKKRDRRPSLVVLPASLLANWKAEIDKFTPSLSSRFVHPSETDKHTLSRMAALPGKSLSGVDVVLTTYGMLQRKDWLLDVDWQLVVLDEAQAIKNPATRQARTVKKLKSRARVSLTGTPVENRLSDLWSIFDFLCPGLLGSAAKFKRFSKSLDQRERDRYKPLRNLVRPYVLRRLKTDKLVISDLPDKSEVRAFCGLSKKQAALYAKSVKEMATAMKRLDGMERRGLVLSYLMRFKQICNHPSQLSGDGEYRPADSGKFTRLAEICEEISSRQEKALVFTQFREMTEPLSEFLSGVFGRSGLVLHGGTAVKKRKALVDRFQREDGPPFLVLSLKAGGTGLNLTAASHVVHFDRWWNPAVENQATDRAYRIGQSKNVLVHKFVCRGTIEERIDAMIDEKSLLADDLLEGGAEKTLTEMSNEEVLRFVSLDIDRATV